jgi:hypothetical protein
MIFSDIMNLEPPYNKTLSTFFIDLYLNNYHVVRTKVTIDLNIVLIINVLLIFLFLGQKSFKVIYNIK